MKTKNPPICGSEFGNDWCVLKPFHRGWHTCRDGHKWKQGRNGPSRIVSILRHLSAFVERVF